MNDIDVEYDFRKDSKCGDPDCDSIKLYELQSVLWNKKLKSGKTLHLKVLSNNSRRILLKSNLTDELSSDRICPHFVGKYQGRFDNWIGETQKIVIQRKARTIGGHIVFPAKRKNGFTVNQARGVNRKISDRFDLTLECIRRFYKNETSVLFDTLNRYKNFFRLFGSFKEYVEFFLLQDFLDNSGNINFSIPFDDFNRSALPTSKQEYENYIQHTIEIIDKRNARIKDRFDNYQF